MRAADVRLDCALLDLMYTKWNKSAMMPTNSQVKSPIYNVSARLSAINTVQMNKSMA